MADDSLFANLQTEYREVCNNFRLLTDIRFKLLTLLPIGTGAGVALTVMSQPRTGALVALIGLFGFVVTAAAALYNLRNDQLYNELVGRAAYLERLMKLKDGAFAARPRPWQQAAGVTVEHSKLWWVYLGSLAAWLFTILHGLNLEWPAPVRAVPAEFIEAAGAIALVLLMAWGIERQNKATGERLRNAARGAVADLAKIPLSPAQQQHASWASLLDHLTVLADRERNDVERALLFYLQDTSDLYWDRPPGGRSCDPRAAAQLAGLVTDMPPRWIFDVASGRRGRATQDAQVPSPRAGGAR